MFGPSFVSMSVTRHRALCHISYASVVLLSIFSCTDYSALSPFLSASCTFLYWSLQGQNHLSPELFFLYLLLPSIGVRKIQDPRQSTPFSSAHQVTSIGLHESGTLSKDKLLYRPNRKDHSLRQFATQDFPSTSTRATANCSRPSLQPCSSTDKQELPLHSTEATAHCSSQVCSSSDKQETSLSGTASTATPVDPDCSSRDTKISKLPTLSLVDCTPLQTLSFVWQIKPTIPSFLLSSQSLQLHPSFSRLLPTATPYTTSATLTLQSHLKPIF